MYLRHTVTVPSPASLRNLPPFISAKLFGVSVRDIPEF